MPKKYIKKKKNLVDYLKEHKIELEKLKDERQIIVDGIKTDYTINRNGNVTSYKCVGGEPTVLKPIKVSENGYYAVNITVGNKQKLIYIHKLVADHFIENPDPIHKTQINHKDGDKSHNYDTNLEWVTPKENIQHAFETGLKKGRKGSEHHSTKLTEKDVIKICKLLIENKKTYKEIASEVNTTYSIVKKIKNKQRWTHISKDYDFSNYIPEKERKKLMKNNNQSSTNSNTNTSIE